MLNRPFAVNGNPRHRSGGIERRKWLALFALEHSRAAYHADFAFYGGMDSLGFFAAKSCADQHVFS